MNTGRVDLPVFDDSFPNCLAALANRPNHDCFAFDFRRFKVVLIRRYIRMLSRACLPSTLRQIRE